jgi:hypothetical protein
MPSSRLLTNIAEKGGFARGKFATGLAIFGGALEYVQRRKEGDSFGGAVTKTVATTAFYNMVPWVVGAQLAFSAGKGLVTGLPMASSALVGMTHSARGTSFGGFYRDTQANATMRQRGVEAIQRSVMNRNSMLGQEARLMRG